MKRTHRILFIGNGGELLKVLAQDCATEVVSSASFVDLVVQRFTPELIVFDSVTESGIQDIRKNEKVRRVPVLVVQKNFSDLNNLNAISSLQKVLLCNSSVVLEKDFLKRIESVLEQKSEMLSSKTASVVKYTILFINKNFQKQLTREQLAKQVGVNEDYLTRIFRKEMGLSLWTYLNVFRMSVASDLLLDTGLPVEEIAHECGFEDASYFSRVFSKYSGKCPTAFRK